MKVIAVSFLLLAGLQLNAKDPYGVYLRSIVFRPALSQTTIPHSKPMVLATSFIPRVTIPKGNVFCRMEDKLTRRTKVWIKVGVR